MNLLITNICHSDADLQAKFETFIFPKLKCPRVAWELLKDEASNVVAEDDEAGAAGGEDQAAGQIAGPLQQLQEGLSKVGQLLTEVLYGIYAGTFDQDMKTMAASSSTVGALMQASPGPDAKNKDSAPGGAFGEKIREVMRLLAHASRGIEPGSENAAPKMGVRSLVRQASDPDSMDTALAQEERDNVWRQAVAVRKRHVSLSVATAATADAYRTAFNACGPVHRFTGVLNESHRLFVASADLVRDSDNEPWHNVGAPPAQDWAEMMKFLNSRDGPRDFVLSFDGRVRSCRREAEDGIKHASKAELWITYSGTLHRAGRTRSTILAAENREVGILGLPCNRTKLKIEKRDALNACGEKSTFFGTYSGANFRTTAELPLLSPEIKSQMGFSSATGPPEAWADKHGKLEPLFWQETKPISYWICMLTDFKIKAVFDMTPGSGALAEACLSLGLTYHGVCLNTKHMHWLATVVDRAACGLITHQGCSPLFQQDLATLLEKHFNDIVEARAMREENDEGDEGEGSESD